MLLKAVAAERQINNSKKEHKAPSLDQLKKNKLHNLEANSFIDPFKTSMAFMVTTASFIVSGSTLTLMLPQSHPSSSGRVHSSDDVLASRKHKNNPTPAKSVGKKRQSAILDFVKNQKAIQLEFILPIPSLIKV